MEKGVSTVCWSELPPLAVEKIYSYLERKDQCRMSQVCGNWNKEYGSPCLWRKLEFHPPMNATDVPEIMMARNYGHFVNSVVVRFGDFILDIAEHIGRQLKLFLDELSYHSQLTSISFLDMNSFMDYISRTRDESIKDSIKDSIKNLFLTQTKIQTVEFKNSDLGKEVLQIIFMNNSRTLKALKLTELEWEEDSITEQGFNITSIDAPPIFEALMNLQTLVMDYSKCFVNIIGFCYKYGYEMNLLNRIGNLETIQLVYDKISDIDDQIDPAAWPYFRKIFPSLRIDINVQDMEDDIEFESLFLPYMPVRSIYMRYSDTFSSPQLDFLLRHLAACRINELLEVLTVTGLRRTSNSAADLLNFLKCCSKLRELTLSFEKPVTGLDAIFNYWIENGPMSLKTVCIGMKAYRHDEAASINAYLADYYCPILQVSGLDLTLIVV